MIVNNVYSTEQIIPVDWQAIIITGILLALSFGYQRIKQKDFPPVMLIILSAIMGIALYA
jgi:hypothetical protein